MTMPEPDLTAEEIDNHPPATAADWLTPAPEDLHPYGFEPRIPGPQLAELTEDPQAGPGWRPAPGIPFSDAFYRAIGDYCRAENAKAEPEPEPEAEP